MNRDDARAIDGARAFPPLMAGLLGQDPGRPLVTFYDDATGERTELSVTTYANWVAKVANLFVDEYLLEEGDTVLLDLPTHWLATVFLGAAWTAGIAVTTDPAQSAHLIVTGPDHQAHEGRDVPTLATALLPFAVRYPETMPDGIDDFGLLWPGQPDAWLGTSLVDQATPAWRHGAQSHSQGEIIDRARSASWDGARLLTDVRPQEECGLLFLSALVRHGSVVLVRSAADDSWPARMESERASAVVRG